jgi:hypothetical protein
MEEWKSGRVEEWKNGRMEGWKVGMDRGRLTMMAGGRPGTEDGRKAVQRSCDEAPFVSVDVADELDSLGEVVRLRGQSYKFPPEVRNPQFGEINYSFVRRRRGR